MEYRVVLAREQADIKSLAALSVLDNGNPETLADAVVCFREEVRRLDPRTHFLVAAFAGAELVGFARFMLHPKTKVWWCRGLVVAEEWQRQGVGTALLKAGLDCLAAQGVGRVCSSTSPANAASRATHVRAGFKLYATAGEDFDGQWRQDYLFLEWRRTE